MSLTWIDKRHERVGPFRLRFRQSGNQLIEALPHLVFVHRTLALLRILSRDQVIEHFDKVLYQKKLQKQVSLRFRFAM